MKKYQALLKTVAAVALASAAGLAAAADTQSLSVTASVTSVCKFNSGQTPTIAFGALDPATGIAVTAPSATANFRCTKGASATVTQGNGLYASGTQKRLKAAGSADYIDYSIALTGASVTGAGFGTDLTVTATGTIAAGAYVNAPADNYSDTVVLSVSP